MHGATFGRMKLWNLNLTGFRRTASQDTSKVEAMTQVIEELEAQKVQKELRKEFLNKGWLKITHRYETGIDQIHESLITARKTMATLQAPNTIANAIGISIVFRFLIVIANLICIHRIMEQMGEETIRKVEAHLIEN